LIDSMKQFYANVADLISKIRLSCLLSIDSWFDGKDTLADRRDRLDCIWIRVVGDDEETVKSRIEALKSIHGIRIRRV